MSVNPFTFMAWLLKLFIIVISIFLFKYVQHIGDFNFPRLADFGAAISGANKLQCQQVLEELDVSITSHISSIMTNLESFSFLACALRSFQKELYFGVN